MNVISTNDEILNSTVSLDMVDGIFGLIMESRGGAKGAPNERNTDYSTALEVILLRLKQINVPSIKVYVVSSNARKIWEMTERALEVENTRDIKIGLYSAVELRKRLSKAQQGKKENIKSKGGNPTKRILIEAKILKEEWLWVVNGKNELNKISENNAFYRSYIFDPSNVEDAKEKISQSIVIRRGQSTFRKNLIEAYRGKCAVTGTNVLETLEVAHIFPYNGIKTNHVTNGLLLRADIHTLFDLGLLGVNKDYVVVVSSSLNGSDYAKYHGKKIRLPKEKHDCPSIGALEFKPTPS